MAWQAQSQLTHQVPDAALLPRWTSSVDLELCSDAGLPKVCREGTEARKTFWNSIPGVRKLQGTSVAEIQVCVGGGSVSLCLPAPPLTLVVLFLTCALSLVEVQLCGDCLDHKPNKEHLQKYPVMDSQPPPGSPCVCSGVMVIPGQGTLLFQTSVSHL